LGTQTTVAISWTDVKSKLADFDRAGLISLIQVLYAASKDNQTFLHARFDLGEDVLKPYKTAIDRWLWPDVFRNQDISIAKAKKAISDYRKAIGAPEGLAELMVFYCERAAGFSADMGLQDERYFAALERMFAQALITIAEMPTQQQQPLWDRLDAVCHTCRDLGYGVVEALSDLLAEYTEDTE
jgi:hypothetical protein